MKKKQKKAKKVKKKAKKPSTLPKEILVRTWEVE